MKPAAGRSVWRWGRLVLLVAGPCALALLPLPSLPWAAKDRGFLVFMLAVAVALLAAWMGFLLPGRRGDDRWARRHPLVWWVLLLAGSGVITAALVGQNLRAQFHLIDDHLLLVYPWPTGRVTVHEFIQSVVHSPEVFSPSLQSHRYRPVDTVMRAAQMVVWGDRAGGYWALRVVMFGVCVCLAWWALWVWLGGLAAGLVLAWVLTLSFWSDIWCRLVPAEGTGTLGTAVVAVAAAGILLEVRRGRGRRRLPAPRRRWAAWWGLLTFGALLACGSKENFLFLLPVVWVFMAWVAWRRGLGWVGWLSGSLVTAWGLWIGGIVGLATLHAGRDYYAQPVTVAARIHALLRWGLTRSGMAWTGVAAGACVLLLAALVTQRGRSTPARRRLWRILPGGTLLALVFAGITLSQLVVYNGEFPTGGRYDFPGLVTAVLGVVAVGHLVVRGLGRRWGRHVGDAALAVALLGVGVCVLLVGYGKLRNDSRENVTESLAHTAAMDKISGYARAQPDRPLLFVAYRPMDAEPVASVLKFMRVRGVVNRAYEYNRGYRLADLADPLERMLAQQVSDLSFKGGQGFLPYPTMPKDQVPFGLFFSGPPMWRGPIEPIYVERPKRPGEQ